MKKLLYVFAGLFLLYFILAIFGPKQIKVERKIDVVMPDTQVRILLGDFKFFHEKWSPWTEKDPAMKYTITGKRGEVGHGYSWSGNEDVGEGEMELLAVKKDSVIQVIRFKGEGDASSYFVMYETSEATTVTWGMTFEVDFFSRPVMLFVKGKMDEMLGADYEKGLQAFKLAAENLHPSSINDGDY
jgi:hypothetical protein